MRRVGHVHLFYDISSMPSAYDEHVCIGCLHDVRDYRLGCGLRQYRRRVEGVRLGPSSEPWLDGVAPA